MGCASAPPDYSPIGHFADVVLAVGIAGIVVVVLLTMWHGRALKRYVDGMPLGDDRRRARARRLKESLREATDLLDELAREMEVRQRAADVLHDEIVRSEDIRALSPSEQAAVSRMVADRIATDSARSL